MNRYPLWKYVLIGIVLVVGIVYTLPNLYGEAPAVQVSGGKATVKVDNSVVDRVTQALQAASLDADFVTLEGASVRARFTDADTQLKAKDVISQALNTDPTDPRTSWREPGVALAAVADADERLPMYLGLDLRGGVHFLMRRHARGLEAGHRHLRQRRAQCLARQAHPLWRRHPRR